MYPLKNVWLQKLKEHKKYPKLSQTFVSVWLQHNITKNKAVMKNNPVWTYKMQTNK